MSSSLPSRIALFFSINLLSNGCTSEWVGTYFYLLTFLARWIKYLAGIFFSGISYFSMKFFFYGVLGLGTRNFFTFSGAVFSYGSEAIYFFSGLSKTGFFSLGFSSRAGPSKPSSIHAKITSISLPMSMIRSCV